MRCCMLEVGQDLVEAEKAQKSPEGCVATRHGAHETCTKLTVTLQAVRRYQAKKSSVGFADAPLQLSS